MDFLGSKIREFRSIFWKEEVPKRCELSRFEYYFESCYKILSWEDITLTLSTFLVSNFVFWCVVYFQLRLFGVAILFVLAGFLVDSYFESKNEILVEASHIDVLEELKTDLNNVVTSLKTLRNDNPSMFCIVMSLLFLIATFVAQNVSGYVICYLLLLAVFFLPLGISVVPPEYLNTVKSFIKVLSSEKGVLAEDELIPFISNKDFNQREADLDSLLTDRTADSITNSLINGLTSMPSHLDADERESLEEEELLPAHAPDSSHLLRTPGDSDTDSDGRPIRFDSRHFHGDGSSSSEEEAGYSANLSFAGVDVPVDTVDSRLSRMATMIQEVIKEGVARAQTVPTLLRKESNSDSDFEIINSDEFE